jgi:hypothetical protein
MAKAIKASNIKIETFKQPAKKADPVGKIEGKVLGVSSQETGKHIQPVIDSAENTAFTVPNGFVLVDAIGKDGQPANKPFVVREKEYNRFFSNPNKFILKKKVK